jgi:hypothetical protein
LTFNNAAPNVLDSSDTAYFLSPGSGNGNSITRYAFATNSNPANDTITLTSPISIGGWSAPPAAAQPNGTTLDTSDGRFVSQTIQNGTSLWNVQSINASGLPTGVLYQFSTTGTSPLFTQGLFTAPNDSVFNLSVATNATKAWVTATRTWPSQGTPKGDAAMLMFNGNNNNTGGWSFNLIATSPSQYSGCSVCRWGDYSATQVDPSNSNLAWGFNQLTTGPDQFNNWTTRAVRVGVGAPGSPVNKHDFNADLMSDVLWYNTTSGQTVIWEINGASVIGGGSPGSVGSPWAIVGQRDFNGDGFYDILWRNGTSGQLVVWLLSGSMVIGGSSPGSVTTDWGAFGTGDFNGDGFGDVLWFNISTGQVVLWFLNGTSVIGGGSPGSAPSPWTVAGTGDFNGDGNTDILWYNTSTGQAVVWLLKGASVIGAGSPGSAANPWTVAGTGDFNGRQERHSLAQRHHWASGGVAAQRHLGNRRRLAWLGGESVDDCRNRRLQWRRFQRPHLVQHLYWAIGRVAVERRVGDRRWFARFGAEPLATPRHERGLMPAVQLTCGFAQPHFPGH